MDGLRRWILVMQQSLVVLLVTVISVFIVIPTTYYCTDVFGIYGFGIAMGLINALMLIFLIVFSACHSELSKATTWPGP